MKIINYLMRSKNKIANISIWGIIFFLAFSILWTISKDYTCDGKSVINSIVIDTQNTIGPILETDKIDQQFQAEENNLNSIKLWFATYNKVCNGNLFVSVTDKNGTVLESWNVNESEIRDNDYRLFTFKNKISDSKDQIFHITITSDVKEGQDAVTVYGNEGYSDDNHFLMNGTEKIAGTICYQISYETNLSSKAIQVYLMIIFIIVLLGLLFVINKKKEVKVENLFLLIMLTIGFMYLIATPLFKICDSQPHIYRIWEITEGHIISDVSEEGVVGTAIPTNEFLEKLNEKWGAGKTITLYNIVTNYKSAELDEKNEPYVFSFPNTAIYSPVLYAPQIAGMVIAKILSDNLIFILYFTRIFSWLVLTFCIYFSIKYTPIGKNAMLFIVLLPMNMQQIISLSADSIILVITCALASLVFYLRYTQKEKITIKQYIMLYTLVVFICSLKMVYLPLLALFLLIPQSKFKSKIKYYMHIAIVSIASLVMFGGWMLITKPLISIFSKMSFAEMDSMAQLKYVLFHPFTFWEVLIRTWIGEFSLQIMSMMGSNLGFYNVFCNQTTLWIFFVMLVVLGFEKWKKTCKDGFDKMGAVIVFTVTFIIFMLIYVAEYLTWSLPEAKMVSGVQGRYFIPVIALLGIGICSNEKNINNEKIQKIPIFIVIVVNLAALTTLVFSNLI